MGIPTIFLAFVILIIVIRYKIYKSESEQKNNQDDFWTKERQSHLVRKQEISQEDFITTNPDAIPDHNESFYENLNEKRLYRAQVHCKKLSTCPMMDLSTMLNSDIRLKYGTTQLETIEGYENNYVSYVQNLSVLGKGLLDLNYYDEAKNLLEEAVSIGADASHIYINLGEIYLYQHNKSGLENLVAKVSASNYMMKHKILTALNQSINSLK